MKRRRRPPRYVRTACRPPAWCLDCWRNTTPCTVSRRRGRSACPGHWGWEFYGVHADLWRRAAPEDATAPGMTVFLCVGCLERRLGRELTPEDFPVGGLNVRWGPHSRRLRSRLGFLTTEDRRAVK